MASEGGNGITDLGKNADEVVLCSNCFQDQGLRLDAFAIGIKGNQKCPNCNSESGHLLTRELVWTLCDRFFVRGSFVNFEYGGSPLIQFNEQHFNHSDIEVSPWLEKDVKLIERVGKIGLFYYGPNAWMYGEIGPLKSLQNATERNQVINEILQTYPVIELSDKNFFYRLRRNPHISHDIFEFDTAPDNRQGKNRFDSVGFPVLYCSADLELCIHECRATVADNLFVGKLVPIHLLKVLDLTAVLNEGVTPSESLDLAMHFVFLAGERSYEICRQIALKAKENGFDGIIFPSFYSHIRTGTKPIETLYGLPIRQIPQLKNYASSQSIPNLALFGRPIREKRVKVECINKVIINKVIYQTSFGPAYLKSNF